MLTGFAPAPRCGFTLIEMMVVVAVLGTLMVVGLPSFSVLLQNYQVRAAAESIQNGLQRARAEAVARNSKVCFKLGAGSAWSVGYTTDATACTTLDSHSSSDSPNVAISATASDLSTAATTLTFNNLGQIVANADSSASLGRAVATSTGGGNQVLHVTINAGGGARVCDPNLPAGNVRKCGTGE